MVERFHRTMKAALMCKNVKRWSEELPLVLLGLRSAYREDLKCSAADLVYGQPLRLPGEFFDLPTQVGDKAEFVQHLHKSFDRLRPPGTNHHSKPAVFVHKALKTCSHVFVRVDTVKRALQQPYEGPYKVLDRSDKYFNVLISSKKQRISIDRLKPAFTCDEGISEYPGEDTQTVVTRSGLRVRFLA